MSNVAEVVATLLHQKLLLEGRMCLLLLLLLLLRPVHVVGVLHGLELVRAAVVADVAEEVGVADVAAGLEAALHVRAVDVEHDLGQPLQLARLREIGRDLVGADARKLRVDARLPGADLGRVRLGARVHGPGQRDVGALLRDLA